MESRNKTPFRGKACLKDQNKFCLSLRKILEDTRRRIRKRKKKVLKKKVIRITGIWEDQATMAEETKPLFLQRQKEMLHWSLNT